MSRFDFDFFLKLSRLTHWKTKCPTDLSDRLNSRYSALVLGVSLGVVAYRQFVFSPIQCLVPREHALNPGWTDYVNNFCWVQNTYFGSLATGPYDNVAKRKEMQLSE